MALPGLFSYRFWNILKNYMMRTILIHLPQSVWLFRKNRCQSTSINFLMRDQMKSAHFEKELYKLLNDSVFGRTRENFRKRVDVKLARQSKRGK